MTLDSLEVYFAHSGPDRSIEYRLDASTDGSTFVNVDNGTFTDDAAAGTQWEEFVFDLTPLDITNVSDAVNFRLYFDTNASTGTSFSVDDIRISGDTFEASPPVPEPASLAIWSLIGVGLGFGYYRLRRK